MVLCTNISINMNINNWLLYQYISNVQPIGIDHNSLKIKSLKKISSNKVDKMFKKIICLKKKIVF